MKFWTVKLMGFFILYNIYIIYINNKLYIYTHTIYLIDTKYENRKYVLKKKKTKHLNVKYVEIKFDI